ncbi:60S ribosomal protein L13-2 isoform B [Glycine soja]|nr:60S ribosomal protein L13-2 isoform B [Glycine soja]
MAQEVEEEEEPQRERTTNYQENEGDHEENEGDHNVCEGEQRSRIRMKETTMRRKKRNTKEEEALWRNRTDAHIFISLLHFRDTARFILVLNFASYSASEGGLFFWFCSLFFWIRSAWDLIRAKTMVKHNNVIPNGHFRKHWQNYVKTWFNQPARKTRRRLARQKKAVKIFPRPTAGPLRPIVHGQTLKYNMKVRGGRGFSLEELKAAGIPKKLAPTIGIAVDHRRKNRSLESLQANVQRLKTYKAKLVVFPRRAHKVKAGDSTPEELANATQVQGAFLPIVREKPTVELVKVTDDMKAFKAYYKLRLERTNKRHHGARLKKAAEAEKEDKK